MLSFNPLKTIAFHALDHAHNIGYVVCGAAATVSFVLAVVALGGRSEATEPVGETEAPGRQIASALP